jgi:hypothetical protein
MFRTTILVLVTLMTSMQARESITGKDSAYINTCIKAVTDDDYFKNFRSMTSYWPILDFVEGTLPFVHYITNCASPEIRSKLPIFNRLECIGNPMTEFYPEVGNFSGATLRYIAIADEIGKLFDLPTDAKIVEVGGGFGGQCYVLSQLQPWSRYYIYDLPAPSALTIKVLTMLNVTKVINIPAAAPLRENQIDLFISNYAYSECDKETQLNYFERLIKKAKRGYIIYNQISHIFSIDSLTPGEFTDLLEKNGIYANVSNESIPTGSNTKLITWDVTKQ